MDKRNLPEFSRILEIFTASNNTEALDGWVWKGIKSTSNQPIVCWKFDQWYEWIGRSMSNCSKMLNINRTIVAILEPLPFIWWSHVQRLDESLLYIFSKENMTMRPFLQKLSQMLWNGRSWRVRSLCYFLWKTHIPAFNNRKMTLGRVIFISNHHWNWNLNPIFV